MNECIAVAVAVAYDKYYYLADSSFGVYDTKNCKNSNELSE